MGDWLFGWLYDLLYILQKSICYILDFIKEVFGKLAGIATVTIDSAQEDLLSISYFPTAFVMPFLVCFWSA